VLGVIVVVAGLGFGAWKFGRKWMNRVDFIGEVSQALGEASGGSDDSENLKQNFWQEDCVVLFIKQTNHLAVADACKEYWKEKLRKNLTLITTPQDELNKGEYELWPAHNGWVRIMGTLEWPSAQFEGLALSLSQKFGTMVFETRDVDFSGAYHFGVYDAGTRKFHAQMEIKIKGDDYDEIVTTEGNDWATAHGYKPGEEGFKEFHLGDADKITQKLGMKMWDEFENELGGKNVTMPVVLRESVLR
jgi:hypothetical protein